MRVQRIDLPDEVAARVYESMKQNFAKTASRLRAEGQSAERRDPRLRRAPAHRDPRRCASATRCGCAARAMPSAAQIYARAYSKDPEFYAFYRSLQAYDRSLGKDGDLLVVTPDGEFFKYLKDPGKPQPGTSDALRCARSRVARMSLNLTDLLAALGLFLVLEGIAPFLNPQGVKRALRALLRAAATASCASRGWAACWSASCILFLVR